MFLFGKKWISDSSKQTENIDQYIHPSIVYITFLSGFGEAGASSSRLQARGGIRPGQVAKLLQAYKQTNKLYEKFGSWMMQYFITETAV